MAPWILEGDIKSCFDMISHRNASKVTLCL
jgi:retron-type reverse transcriptase